MSHHIIHADNLFYQYPDGTNAVQGVSFTITHGESVAIIGANGAGKSSLILQLNGSLQASSGQIKIGDTPVTKRTLTDIRRTVGFVFQDSDDQLFMPTVYDDVAFGPANLGLEGYDLEQRVDNALADVELEHLKHRMTHHLSGGEKRRIAIATVLAMEPNILVMDEPTANLDPKGRRGLIQLLKTFSHTKIIATHDLDMVLDVCERTIILHDGKIVADDITDEILKNKELLENYSLELPLQMQGCPNCSKTA